MTNNPTDYRVHDISVVSILWYLLLWSQTGNNSLIIIHVYDYIQYYFLD